MHLKICPAPAGRDAAAEIYATVYNFKFRLCLPAKPSDQTPDQNLTDQKLKKKKRAEARF
jgi:hypothetical protein